MGWVWHDVTIPMQVGMTTWPDDPPFELSALSRISRGDSCNTSLVAFSTHTGTHLDAPWHFVDKGKRVGELDASLFFGEALLIDVGAIDTVHAADLGPAPLPPRILVKTRNSDRLIDGDFRRDYVALEVDAAQRLIDENVKLVAVDGLSVAPFRQRGQETHFRLLRHGVIVIEGIQLGNFLPGRYQFIVLPMLLSRADGAPCRAFLGCEE